MHLSLRALAAAALVVVSLAIVPLGRAQSQLREYDFDIPRLPIVQFFSVLSNRTEVAWGYLPTSPEEEATEVGPLKGRYTIDAALAKVLAPTDFTFAWMSDRLLSLIPPSYITQPTLPEWAVDHELDRGPIGEAIARARKRLQGIVVVASRISSLDPLQAPTMVFERKDIEALGVATLPEVFRYLSNQPYSRAEVSNTGDQRVELRGLGRDTTLVLINGRRAGGSAATFDIDAFDLNTIPLAAVERIEVILDTPPLSVGADAIGGMVNIVLKSDARDPVAEIRYGTAEGGAAERRASVSAGVVNDRMRVSTVLDFFKRDDLAGAERDRWRNQDYRRFGSMDFRSQTSNPGNVASLTSANLPGLSSPFAAVPPHPSSTSLMIADFQETAGTRNFDSLQRFRSIVPERERISAVGSIESSFSPSTLAFGEFFFTSGNTVVRDIPFALSNVIVPETNPFNPFGVPVAVSFLPTSVAPREWWVDNKFLRALAGLQGRWTNWRWEVAALHTSDSTHVAQRNELSVDRVSAALAQSSPDLALNVFDDGPGGSAQLLQSLIANPVVRSYSSRMLQGTATLRGPLLHLKSGDVAASFGAEWRRSEIAAQDTLLGSPDRSIKSAFAEVQVPFVKRDMNIPGVEQLALSLAGRFDEFSDVGSTVNSQYALTWNPLSAFSVRASYGTSYRAPSLFELNQPVFRFPGAVSDLRRDNEIANIVTIAGGNPDLSPTKAESWSVGFTFARRAAVDLNLSATYWQSHLQDRVSPFLLQTLLIHDDLFADRVARESPTAIDIAAGRPGMLRELDVRPDNVGVLEASGIDAVVTAAFDTRFGRFSPALSTTWMDRFAVTDFPGIAPDERVGLASVFGTIPDWYAIGALGWTGEVWSAAIIARFISSYRDFNILLNQVNGRRVPSQTVVDAQVSLSLDENIADQSAWSGFRFTAGITNLFDRRPAFAEVGVDQGFDVTQGDLKGRFGYLRLTKDF